MAYSCCAPLLCIYVGIATSDSCTKRLPGRVEDSYYWFVIGEKRTGSDPTYLRKSTLQGQGNYDRVEQVAITLQVCS